MDCTAIILAGGQGTRLGRLGQLTNKAMLIAYDRPLLIRHLDHLVEAGFDRIVVSTNPNHYPAIAGLVKEYRPHRPVDIEVLNNPAHFTGPIEALQVVVGLVSTRRCLMVLADEYVLDNGFTAFAEHIDEDDDYTAIAPVIDPRELKRGGYAHCSGGYVEAIIEKAEPEPENAFPSPGTTLFSTQDTLAAIEAFLQSVPPGASVGDFFNFRCQLGQRLQALMGPDFVNINTPNYLLLANLYGALEALSEQSDLYASLAATATALRSSIAATF